MRELATLDYPALLARGERLRAGITAALRQGGHPACTSGHGSVFSLWFAEAPPADYAAALRLADAQRSLALHLALRRHGVMTLRSPFGRMFLSAAHTDAEVEATIAAFTASAPALHDPAAA
jgi:glutamate-1-semialdehyde 2,1-aminomutase